MHPFINFVYKLMYILRSIFDNCKSSVINHITIKHQTKSDLF